MTKRKLKIPIQWRRRRVTREQFEAAGGYISKQTGLYQLGFFKWETIPLYSDVSRVLMRELDRLEKDTALSRRLLDLALKQEDLLIERIHHFGKATV